MSPLVRRTLLPLSLALRYNSRFSCGLELLSHRTLSSRDCSFSALRSSIAGIEKCHAASDGWSILQNDPMASFRIRHVLQPLSAALNKSAHEYSLLYECHSEAKSNPRHTGQVMSDTYRY